MGVSVYPNEEVRNLAPELVYAAEDFAQVVQALLKIIGEVTKDSKSGKKFYITRYFRNEFS